jgi:hypothetical protein
MDNAKRLQRYVSPIFAAACRILRNLPHFRADARFLAMPVKNLAADR